MLNRREFVSLSHEMLRTEQHFLSSILFLSMHNIFRSSEYETHSGDNKEKLKVQNAVRKWEKALWNPLAQMKNKIAFYLELFE